MVQVSHLYMTTEKTIALIIWTLVSKVMSLLFNTLSRFVIAFLPRSKCLFNFLAEVTVCSAFGAQENLSKALLLRTAEAWEPYVICSGFAQGCLTHKTMVWDP